ncbi:MAG: elongation factor G [Bacteroidetes bacterium]|nr:elongation factor G [Bacteroidota bacterium]
MSVLHPSKIRNIAFAGHSDSGKTTLTESIAYSVGLIQKMGSVNSGNTLTDYHDDEIEKKVSINLGLINGNWKDVKLNILDTPGYLDFVGDVKSAMRVADTVVITVNAVSGIEVGTENVWDYAMQKYKPTMFLITKLDRDNADFNRILAKLKEYYGHYVVPVQFPVDEGLSHKTIIDCIMMKALTFEPGKRNNMTVSEIPERYIAQAEAMHNELVETVAETDEVLMNKFFENGNLNEEELKEGIMHGMVSRTFFPVFCCSPESLIGTERLLDVFANLCPSPIERGPEHGWINNSEEDILIQPDINGKPIAFVFKTSSEPHLGEMSIFRVYSGTITPGMDLINAETHQEERINQLFTLVGNKRSDFPGVGVGDIAAVVKLKNTHTNNTLSAPGSEFHVRPVEFPVPVIRTAIKPHSKNDETKISAGLTHLHEEDPSFQVTYDPELAQTIISGQGELHLDVILKRMKDKYGVEIDQEDPKIPYRETIKGKARVQGKFKKQSGGKGQYGDVWLRLEPLPRGGGFEFVDEVVGGAVPGKFIPSVEKGVFDRMTRGVLAGFKGVDIKVTIDDGSYHPVDSSDMAFKMAGSMAYKKAFLESKPILLEPIYKVTIKAPEEYMGDVMGDISSRRGKIQGMDADGHFQIINASIPLAEMSKYQSALRSMTQGRGTHFREFDHYEEVPFEVAQKVIAAYKEAEEED